jgi:hypothetical protein
MQHCSQVPINQGPHSRTRRKSSGTEKSAISLNHWIRNALEQDKRFKSPGMAAAGDTND